MTKREWLMKEAQETVRRHRDAGKNVEVCWPSVGLKDTEEFLPFLAKRIEDIPYDGSVLYLELRGRIHRLTLEDIELERRPPASRAANISTPFAERQKLHGSFSPPAPPEDVGMCAGEDP